MRIAVCPGSFDPITKGHLDIITRAAGLFDKVIVVVLPNPKKTPVFSVEERMDLISKATEHIPNTLVDTYDGLLAEYARGKKACAIVKGLRAVTDFEYEFQMALFNKRMYPEAETIFLTTAQENMYLSSSIVKQVAGFGGDISDFIPETIMDEVTKRLYKPSKNAQEANVKVMKGAKQS